MELLLFVGLLLAERLRLDLHVRRWWARAVPQPTFALAGRVPVPAALAGFDVRRLVPRLLTLLAVLVLWRTLSSGRPQAAYEGVNQTVGFYWAALGLLVLVLVASVGGRDRDSEVIAALPVGARPRLVGVALTLVLAALVVYALATVRQLQNRGASYDALLPGPWELAQPGLLVLGGGLLGLLVARLVPAWVAVPVAAVAAVTWTGSLFDTERWPMLGPLLEWVKYDDADASAAALVPGSLAWHNAYLAGLCVLALVAALLREPGRRLGLVAAGVAVAAGTLVAALLALP